MENVLHKLFEDKKPLDSYNQRVVFVSRSGLSTIGINSS
jgi:hypothetical protein